ncbi:hypothetical protein [Enterobacter ludwigii]
MSCEAELKNAFDFISDNFGKLDIVINNAGIELECGVQNISYEAL